MSFVDRLLTGDENDQITLDEIKDWVKVENDLDNDILNQLRIVAVQEAFNFMQNDFTEEVETTGELVVKPIPFVVKTACMMYIAYLFENRGNENVILPLNCMKLMSPYKRLVGT